MAYKQLLFKSNAREKLLRGVNALGEAVRVTLGPKSKSVLIEKKWGHPLVCNDGVTIAKEINFKDAVENLGAQMIREAAEKTGDAVGDGTSTSTILAQEIFTEGLRNIAAGASAVDLRRGLEHGLKIAVELIKKMSRPVESQKERAQVAAISAHNDAVLGQLVADATERVGKEGLVSVEEAKGTETVLDVVEGMEFDRGYVSPYFITDPERMEVVFEDALILLYDGKISTMKDIVHLLENVANSAKPLLIVAEDLDGEALATLVVNKVRGVLHCAAVKSPGFGDRRKAIMQDLAVLTGAKFISEELGLQLEHATIENLGKAKRIIIDKDSTKIIDGAGKRKDINARCNEIKKQIEDTTSDYDREKLQDRLAKLSGGVAVIRVGAPTEAELKSKKEALDDAISATRAAVAEGIVPGCGLSLIRAIDAIESEEDRWDGDFKTGLKILKHALEAPTRQIALNSSVDGGVVVNQMRNGKGNFGFDAAQSKYVDLIEAGIIDPTKVVRIALENAVSIASTLLLTEATLTEVPEPDRETKYPNEIQAEV